MLTIAFPGTQNNNLINMEKTIVYFHIQLAAKLFENKIICLQHLSYLQDY
jgi:hypothetical protein